MVEHVYIRAQAASSVTGVIVATDDIRIYDAVRAFGGEARLTKEHHRSGMERLAEVAPDLSCEYIVNVQGDEPLVSPDTIDLVLAALINDRETQMSTVCCPISAAHEISDPNVVKVVTDQAGFALYFSRAPIPSRPPGLPVSRFAHKHIGVYAYRRTFLLQLATFPPTPLETAERLEQMRAIEYGYRIRIVEIAQGPIGVDTAEDLDRVRRIVSAGTS